MTSVITVESECSLCGKHSEQTLVSSTAPQGLPDLDSRPSEPLRSFLPCWVQRCPNCGYCATDIALEYPLADGIVRSADYKKLLRRRSLPEKAREFLAWALIQMANDEYGGAGWAAVHAAWACDDAENPKGAVECRKLALERFARQRARLGHITGFEDPGVEELVLADLCRRSAQFEAALRWVDAGLARRPIGVVVRALRMERERVEQKNLLVHSVEEMLDNS